MKLATKLQSFKTRGRRGNNNFKKEYKIKWNRERNEKERSGNKKKKNNIK